MFVFQSTFEIKMICLGVVTAATLLSGCTTFGRSSAQSDQLIQEGSPLVIQVGHDNPEVSPHERAYWLQQRQGKSILGRMNGNLATGEAENAVLLAKARLAEHPGEAQALGLLVSALVMARNYEMANYYASMLEQVQPGSAIALNAKGLARALAPASKAADYAQAAVYFQQAMDSDQTQVAAGLNLGYLQLEVGNASAAAATFKVVGSRCQNCIASLLGAGIALARSRQFPAAVSVFNDILSQRPNHAVALYNLALVYKNGYNNKAKAEAYLVAVLRDSRTQDRALRDRAQLVLRQLKGQASSSERIQMAADESVGNQDADTLMTAAGAESKDDE